MAYAYTLVQHSHGGPGWTRAVEEVGISHAASKRVLEVGGVVFDTYEAAEAGAMAENYPEGVDGLIPKTRGMFSTHVINTQRIYVPMHVIEGGRTRHDKVVADA